MNSISPTDQASQAVPTGYLQDMNRPVTANLETDSAYFTRTEPGIIIVKVKPVHITLDMSDSSLDAILGLAEKKPWALVVDLVDLKGTDRLVRHRAADPDRFKGVSALAIVAGNPLTRFLGNFFIRVRGPSRPTRLFADPHQAIKWAQTHLQPQSER